MPWLIDSGFISLNIWQHSGIGVDNPVTKSSGTIRQHFTSLWTIENENSLFNTKTVNVNLVIFKNDCLWVRKLITENFDLLTDTKT